METLDIVLVIFLLLVVIVGLGGYIFFAYKNK
ncbi:hypothetical protein C826_01482 [Helicobacter bilis WiWa]|uniref:Uncharacterized protein n=2 Tax=Helicobacter bilis TaxID=37372 RepID=T5LTS3_9HELI|nr:hypothetical protein C826_01482 [Helicobacter bilis WiWa]EQM94600.1 hypothetical protein HRAG_02359 [Helicobacter bilis ATCC 43879]